MVPAGTMMTKFGSSPPDSNDNISLLSPIPQHVDQHVNKMHQNKIIPDSNVGWT